MEASKRRLEKIHPALLFAAAVMLALIFTRIFLHTVEDSAPRSNAWIRKRISESIQNLPMIAGTPGDIALFLGASETESTIDPLFIDERLAQAGTKVTSYNLAVRNITLAIEPYLHRIAEELRARDKRVKFSVIKFTASRSTIKTGESDWKRALEELECPAYSPTMLKDRLFRDPMAALRLSLYKTLFSCLTPYSEFGYLQARFSPPELPANFNPETLYLFDQVHTAIWHGANLHAGPAWDPQTRGFFNWGLPKTEAEFLPLMLDLRDPGLEQVQKMMNVEQYDAEELHFDPAIVQQFIRAVREIQAVSERTYILYFPDKPTFAHREDARRRLHDVLQEIGRATGARILDYSGSAIFDNLDYMDLLHLNESGRKKLMSKLAEDISADR